MEFIDLKAQQMKIKPLLDERISRVLAHGQYILGPEVKELEEQLEKFVGVKYAISCANGTDALQLALMALEIGPGDEVITTAFSFAATVETICLLGAHPVFVDIDPLTYNLDPAKIEEKVTSKTKAIIPVSLYGRCADFDPIRSIAQKHGFAVIEDAAQSFGAKYKGQRSCGLTEIATTSFFPSKPLGCYGDGGACFTNDDRLAEKLRSLRVHGQKSRYEHVRVGVNSRLDTLQAAILLAKLSVFEEELLARDRIGRIYSEKLKDSGVKGPSMDSNYFQVFAQYTIEVDHRDQFQAALKEEGIPTVVHYPTPLHLQSGFRPSFKSSPSRLPYTEAAAERVVSLPMHPYLSLADQTNIIDIVKRSV